MKLIGVCGLARCGKDTFFEISRSILKEKGVQARKFAFADSLKSECDELLGRYTNVSAFTEKDEEKKMIRPLLVAYGTNIRRSLNENCWIEKIEEKVFEHLNLGETVFITDVRFENEIDWIHRVGGKTVHITREGTSPPNLDEETNDPILKRKSNISITCNNFPDKYIDKLRNTVEMALQSIL
jgi:hypothetical protein